MSRQPEQRGIPFFALNTIDNELQSVVANAVMVSIPTSKSSGEFGNVFSKMIKPEPNCIWFDKQRTDFPMGDFWRREKEVTARVQVKVTKGSDTR